MRMSSFALVAASALLASCGSSEATTPSTASSLTFKTGPFTIGTGDVFECFYTDTVTTTDLAVHATHGEQAAGGHHITLYYVDTKHPVGHHPCTDSEMVSWHMVGGTGGDSGAGGSEPSLSLPEGYALKVPAGKQMVMQIHYINTTGKARTVDDTASLDFLQPSQVKGYANSVAGSAEAWKIPAKSPLEITSTCTLKQDLNVILLLGHMHELGKHFKLEQLDDKGNPATVLYDQDWAVSYVSHPPVKRWDVSSPLVLKAGTKLKKTCSWNNDTADDIIFPREMCVFFAYYYPDVGELYCDEDPAK